MDHGSKFLKRQVAHAVALHGALVEALEQHASDADDLRYRDLCTRYIVVAREHYRAIEAYYTQLGAADMLARRAPMVSALGLADAARDSDYARLLRDLAVARQCDDACATFREAGRILGNQPLHQLGEVGKRHHEAFVHDAARLAQWMFIEQVQGTDASDLSNGRERDFPAS